MEMKKIKKITLAAFFFSGTCGLIYEIIWVRVLCLVFGNTTYAVSTVLAAFMGGLCLGSWYFGRLVDKKESPLRFFALLEAGIGIYCIFTPLLFKLAEGIYLNIVQGTTEVTIVSVLIRFIISFIIVLIPTTLMGGTLPVLSKFFIQRKEKIGWNVGILYSVNTWGAVLGSFVTGFILIMLLGVRGTLYLAAVINIAIAGIVFVFSLRSDESYELAVDNQKITGEAHQPGSLSILVFIGIALSGFTALAYEVTWTRVLSMVIGSSVYAFSIMLTAFLSGIALGSFIFARFLDKNKNLISLFGFTQAVIGISVLLLIPIYGILPFTFLKLFKTFHQSFIGFQFVQFLLCFGIMLIPTTLSGAALPIVSRIYGNEFRTLGRKIGNVYAANTIGAIAGSVLAGFVLIPLIGLQRTISFVAMINVGLAIILLFFGLKGRRWTRALACSFLVFFTIPYALALPSWDKNIIASGIYQYAPDYIKESTLNPEKEKEIWGIRMEGKEMLFYKEGTHFTVGVQKHRDGVIGLSIDGKTDASNGFQGDMVTQQLSAHLPILLHPNPEDVLVIGLASGVTLGTVTKWNNVKGIDCVEIEPSMIEASHYFDEWNNTPLRDKRVKIIMNDARNYLLTAKKKYDIIISEPSNPWISGCAPLFTKEYYELVKSKLKDNGIFCGWVQIYNMGAIDYITIINTLNSIFPHISIWGASEGDTLIIATPERLSIDYQGFKERIKPAEVDMDRIDLGNPLDLLAKFIMVPGFQPTRLNTDNNPFIEFSAGRNLYNPEVSGKTYDMLSENTDPAFCYLTNFDEYENLIKRYLNKGLYIPAEKMLIAKLALENSVKYCNLLGFTYLRQQKYGKAIEALNRAISMDHKYIDAYVNLAEVYHKQKDYKEALDFINKALIIKPDYAPAYNLEGLVWLAEGKHGQALKDFEKAQKLNPAFLEPYINQAIVYLDYIDVPPAAFFILKDAADIAPKSAEVCFHLGRALFKLKDYRQAADMFSKAIFHNPDYEEIVRETLAGLQKKGQ